MANSGLFQSFSGMGDDDDDEGDDVMDQLTIDEELPPLEKLRRYTASDIALQRLVHVKSMSDTARQVGFADALETLTAVIGERVEDEETDVRLTLAEQIGELALVFIETGGEDGYHQTVEVLLKRTGKLLVDPQATVRQAAGAALVQIAKHLTKEHLESPALGMVLCLAHDESDDHRQLAAHLLNDMAASFGKEICTNFCVPELRSLSEDQEFGVRKAAARNMALVCRTVGQELSEEKMLPVYMQLAKDEIWGVRKSCAEALSDMAACMPSSCRSEQLVTVFTGLQNDVSRWVRFAAFQQLGPLIATMEPEEVSEEILKQFTSMAHMEGETTLYCAFNMPGVLVTVGPSRWHLLKDAYMVLVSDVQWKVRKSLAYSLHEVAHILGQEVTESDICEQVFDKFLKDLDEVRVGVLKHFAAFVGVLSPEKRKGYLEVLTQSYLEPENIGRDWRVRQILATEIGKLTDVLDLRDIQEVLEPTLFNFANDPVATVRGSAHAAFGPLLLRYQQEGGDFALRDRVIDQITAFAAADKFAERQVFVQICEKLATTEDEQRQAACIDLLEKFFLAKALSLASDRVANVRLTVARMLAAIVQEPLVSRLTWTGDVSRADCMACVEGMDRDQDRDVRYYIGVATGNPPPLTSGNGGGSMICETPMAGAIDGPSAEDAVDDLEAATVNAEEGGQEQEESVAAGAEQQQEEQQEEEGVGEYETATAEASPLTVALPAATDGAAAAADGEADLPTPSTPPVVDGVVESVHEDATAAVDEESTTEAPMVVEPSGGGSSGGGDTGEPEPAPEVSGGTAASTEVGTAAADAEAA